MSANICNYRQSINSLIFLSSILASEVSCKDFAKLTTDLSGFDMSNRCRRRWKNALGLVDSDDEIAALLAPPFLMLVLPMVTHLEFKNARLGLQ